MEQIIKSYHEKQKPVINRVHRLAMKSLLFRLLLLRILPMGFFAGLRISRIDDQTCSVTVPCKWLNKNPFRSTYFAVLAMAAEMSTGLPAFSFTWKSNPPVSMLITGVKATFSKKATGITTFTFSEARAMQQAIEKAITTGEGVVFECESTGKAEDGKEVARFYFNWSFRVKPSN